MKENTKTNCIKYEKILPLFFHNKLGIEEKLFIKEHSKVCTFCKQKFLFMQKVYRDFNKLKTKYIKKNYERAGIYTINEYNNFEENLSAYIDNELGIKEAIKIKEFIIRHPYAKAKFKEDMALLRLFKQDLEMYRQKINMREKLRNLILRIRNFLIRS